MLTPQSTEGVIIATTLLTVVTGWLVAYYAIPVIVKMARAKNLVDTPDDERKLHSKSIPSLGGVAILSGFLISYSLWVGWWLPPYYPYMVAALIILFSAGIKDDIMVISPWKKSLLQIAAAATIVIGGNIRLLHFDGFLGVHDGAPDMLAATLTIFAIVIIINAYNLIDGIDGLAGSMGMIGALFFGTWFFMNGYMADALLAVALVGALAGFLVYNRYPARIFMGDTGSMTIGLVMAVMAFRMINLNPQAPVITLETPTVFAFSLMIVPMFDTFRIIIIRLAHKLSPLRADKRHMHHCLIRFGYSHRGICRVLIAASVIIAGTSYFINHLEIHLYALILLVMGVLIAPSAWLLKRITKRFMTPKKSRHIEADPITTLIDSCIHGLENRSETEAENTGHLKIEHQNRQQE